MNNLVLIVDDNKHAADAMGKLLTLVGFNIRIVYSGREALETVRTNKPRVILLDIRMPEMDGYAVAKELRATAELADIPLVALTGFGQEDDKQQAEQAGFTHHLTKPASLTEIQAVLNQHVDLQRV